jgi:hypothetical protein
MNGTNELILMVCTVIAAIVMVIVSVIALRGGL